MANPQPPSLKSPSSEQQLNLPLNQPAKGRLINPQEVWPTLTQPQQAALFQQMTRICCHLLNASVPDTEPKEVSDDQS